MVRTSSKPPALEEFLKLPETKPASEYIDGQIIQKPMPQGKHSAIQTELSAAINAVVKPQRMARAFSELRCTFGRRSTVPDVSVFTWDRIPRDDNGAVANVFQAAPDWTIEILSPDQSQTKVTKNILHCLKHETQRSAGGSSGGCVEQAQMGWLIDPGEQTVFVYLSQQQPEVFDEPEDQLPVPSFASELRLTAGDLFAWLLD